MNRCEDYPCCGHEANDCDGSLYGSDESIKADAAQHAFCDHEAGHCERDEEPDPEDEDLDYEYGGMRMRGEGAYLA